MKLFITCILSCYVLFANAQNNVFRKIWTPTAGFTRSGDLIHTSDGNLLICGNTTTGGMAILKTDMNGSLLWQQNYTGTKYMLADQVLEASSGFYILGACIDTASGINYHVTFTDLNGIIQWSKTYAVPANYEILSNGYSFSTGIGEDNGIKAKLLSDGSIVFIGFINRISPLASYAQVVRVDGTGTILWKRIIPADAFMKYAIETIPPDMNSVTDRIIVATSNGNSQLVVALDINGGEKWAKSYTGYNWFSLRPDALRYTTDHHLVFAGLVPSITTLGTYDMGAVKIDTTGSVVWANSYDYDTFDWCNEIVNLPGGEIALCGGRARNPSDSQPVMVKLATNGNPDWGFGYPVPGHPRADAISAVSTGNGELVFLGYTSDSVSVSSSYYLVKTNFDGYSGCNDTAIKYGSDTIPVVASPMPSTNNSSLTSGVTSYTTLSPLFTGALLCASPIGIPEKTIPAFSCSPNPVSGLLHINGLSGQAEVHLFNSTGQTVPVRLTNNTIDCSNLPTGIYILLLKDNQQLSTQRIAVTKQ